MHSIKKLLPLLIFAAFLSSCSEDFEVAAPYRPITVIYGLMDVGDTAHYIRIQKAFLDDTKSALDMARTADSNFYTSLSVHLKEFSGAAMLADETLQRVDLNNEGFPKDSGVFFNTPSYAYKTKRTLIPGLTYRLVVTNTATGQVDSVETPIIENKQVAPPRGFIVYEFNSSFEITFAAQQEINKFTLSVQAPENSQIFEGIIRFHYVDKEGTVERQDSVDWKFASGAKTARALVELTTLQRSFYYFLRDAIGPAPANVQRLIDSADLFVWAGSPAMATYQQINGAQGGITADQIKPLYTNILSNRANSTLGLFTTRARAEYHNVGIDERSLDSLKNSPITSALNFRGRTAH